MLVHGQMSSHAWDNFSVNYVNMFVSFRGHQRGARKDYVGRPRACSKNNISMINVFTSTNINTKIIEGK